MFKTSKLKIGLLALSILTTLTHNTAQAASDLPKGMVKKYLSMNKLDKIKAKSMMTKYMMATLTPKQLRAAKVHKQTVVNVKTGKKHTALIQFTKNKPRQVSLNNGKIIPVAPLAGKKFKHNNNIYRYTRGYVGARYMPRGRYLSLSSRARKCMKSRRCRSIVGRFIRKNAHKARYIPTRHKRKLALKKRRALKRRRTLRRRIR